VRNLVITQNITLDGSIEMLGDWFDPSDEDPEQLEVMQRHTERGDALLLGRQTFEDMRGYWPLQTDDQTGVTAHLNAVHKYVVSSTMSDPEWQNSTILADDWLGQVRALKEQDGKEIGVTGSITLCHALIKAGAGR
jgi:dihydrofolate reductase